jgi:hypothetical protein
MPIAGAYAVVILWFCRLNHTNGLDHLPSNIPFIFLGKWSKPPKIPILYNGTI